MNNADILPRIYKYCAYQDRSRKEIVEKLISLEVEPSEIPDILQLLKEERMWDEARFARSFARGKFSIKKWGRSKIRYELKKKGLNNDLIEKALKSEIEEEDYLNMLRRLAAKKTEQWKGLSTFDRRQKVLKYLVQKGYEWDLVMQILP